MYEPWPACQTRMESLLTRVGACPARQAWSPKMDVTAVVTLSASARPCAPSTPIRVQARARTRQQRCAHAPTCVLQCVRVHAALVNASPPTPWASAQAGALAPPAPRTNTADRPDATPRSTNAPRPSSSSAPAHTHTALAQQPRAATTAPRRADRFGERRHADTQTDSPLCVQRQIQRYSGCNETGPLFEGAPREEG